jgi:hypothetical protein
VIKHTIERRAAAKQTFTGEERLIAFCSIALRHSLNDKRLLIPP